MYDETADESVLLSSAKVVFKAVAVVASTSTGSDVTDSDFANPRTPDMKGWQRIGPSRDPRENPM